MREQFEELHPLFDLEKDEQGEYTCVLTRVTWLGFELGKKTLQAEITDLQNQLACCCEENKGLVRKVSEQRQINESQLNKLINKSVRLTDAEFEYKWIRGLQAKDCLQIMRLTARNEKLNNELKTMRGVNDINLTR